MKQFISQEEQTALFELNSLIREERNFDYEGDYETIKLRAQQLHDKVVAANKKVSDIRKARRKVGK